MAKDDETPRTNPAEIESLIEQIRGTNLDPRAKDKVERLLRTVLTLVELLQRKNTSIKKLREMIFGNTGGYREERCCRAGLHGAGDRWINGSGEWQRARC